MKKKSFYFYKDFFGQWFAGGTGKRENEYTIYCTPIKGGGDMKAFYVGLLY